MSNPIPELFTVKFSPKDLNSLIAPRRIKEELAKGLIQNLLFYGSPGTGKTTSMDILSKPYTTMRINAREEANVDLIRNKLMRFCTTMSLEGGKETLKCVIIDEFDGASASFLDAIKVPIEKYANIVRFIAATNFINKIPEAVLDRFNPISFDAIDKEEEEYLISEYKKRASLILNAAKISYTDEVLNSFIMNEYPSFRSVLKKIQSFYVRGIKELTAKNFNINFDYEDLFKLCLNKPDKPYENYKFIVSEFSNRIDDALDVMGNDFIEYIKAHYPQKLDKIPLIVITVAEHQAQRTLVIDPLITLLSCCLKIQMIINQ